MASPYIEEAARRAGPWHAQPNRSPYSHPRRFQVRGPNEAGPTGRSVASDMTQADAHLTAAAPDLLAALIALVDCGVDQDRWQKARAAIAKAEGSTQP